MQGQKYEFNRKPRRLLARSPSGSTTRLRSKEQEDPRSPLGRTPQKKQQLIVNLRTQLGNLRQQLNSIDHRESESSSHASITEGKSVDQCQAINQYYFEKGGKKIGEGGGEGEGKTLARQLSTSRQKNSQLERVNQELRRRLRQLGKERQTGRMLEKSHNKREGEEGDRTVSIHKQFQESKRATDQMKKQIVVLREENEALRSQVETLLKEREEEEGLRKDYTNTCNYVGQLQEQVSSLSGRVEKLKCRVSQLEVEKAKLGEKVLKVGDSWKESNFKLKELAEKCREYEREMNRLRQEKEKTELQGKGAEQSRKIDEKKLRELRELREVVGLQEKSLRNQQSDINFLEGEARKAAFLRLANGRLGDLLDTTNSYVVVLELQTLNQKYSGV